MEYVDNLFYLANKNQYLVFIISVLISFVESFVPILPLVLIVSMNALFLGFTKGIIASTIGSCIGTFLIYFMAKKLSKTKFFNKIRNDKIDRIANWIRNQNPMIIFVCYASSFVPSFLISIGSGLSNVSYKCFLLSMILGKFCLFLVASYIGDDIYGVLSSPLKILIIVSIFIIMFLLAKRINLNIENKK